MITKNELLEMETTYKKLLQENKNLKKQHASFSLPREGNRFTYIGKIKTDKTYVINSSYLPFVQKIKTGEKAEIVLANILEKKNAKQIIEGILFYFLQEIHTIEELKKELSNPSEQELLQNEYFRLKEEMKIYQHALKELTKEDTLTPSTSSTKRNIIFLRSQVGNPFLYSDLKKSVPSEYYANFLELFSSLQQGEIQNLKKVVESPFWEAKGFATRILFTFETNNSVCLAGAFIKKTNQYNSSMRALKDARALLYNEQKGALTLHCTEEDFLKEESVVEEKVLTLLKGGNSNE